MHTRTLHVAADHPAFAGHFPGRPLLPGVTLLAEVLEALAADPALSAQLGPTLKLGSVKFLSPVLPGATLSIHVQPGERGVRFEVRDGPRLAASGQFEVHL